MQPSSRYLKPGIVTVFLLAGLCFWPVSPSAQQNGPSEIAPGFGLSYGEGKTEHGGEVVRGGFTSRRLTDGGRTGSLALMAEQHRDTIQYVPLVPGLGQEQVSLLYQTVYLEMKRYLSFGSGIQYYWGVRGGYTRITGEETSSGSPREFTTDQVAPLALLALPLMIEHPGFLLLAFMDGASAGMTVDIIPERIWLDYQIGTVLLPRYRDDVLALEDQTLLTQTLQLMIVF